MVNQTITVIPIAMLTVIPIAMLTVIPIVMLTVTPTPTVIQIIQKLRQHTGLHTQAVLELLEM